MTPQEQQLLAQLTGGQLPPDDGLAPNLAQADVQGQDIPPELLAQLQGQEQLPIQQPSPEQALQEKKARQFKQAYSMPDDDFKEYGYSKLVKQSQSNQKKTKLTNWKQEPSIQDLKHDYNHAQTAQSRFINELQKWQNLYDAPKFGGKNHKGSRINPRLIRKQAEWTSPALSEPFLSTNNLFDVKPLTFEDVDRARQNALILNRQFNTQLNKVKLVDGVIRQLVKNGSCVLRMGWEYQEKQVQEQVPLFNYIPVPVEQQEQVAQQLAELEQLMQSEPDSYEALPDEVKAGYEMSVEKGMPYVAEPAGFTQKTAKRVLVNKPTVEICNIKNIFVDPTCKGVFENAQFVVHAYESSLSELKKQGIYHNLGYLMEQQSSTDGTVDKPSDDVFRFQDNARRKLTVYEYWGYWDTDGTGETKPIVATWVGDTMIRMEDNPFPNGKLPFVIFNYLPEEDSVWGIPNAELLGDNQEILGAVTRGMIDLLGKSANSQTGYAKNLLDSANKVKFATGQDYEYNQGFDPRVHIHTHKYPEIPQSAMAMVQMMNNEAESLSGIKAFASGGINASHLGDSATAARGVLDAVSKREMSILRRICDGFIQMGRFIMGMNSEFLSEKEVVRITNKEFVTIRRDDLAGEYDLTLTISTAEGDENKAQQLAFLLQTIGNSMGMGLTQTILAEIAHLRKMPDLAHTIESYQEEPNEMEQQMQQLQMEKLQAEVELLKAEAQEAAAKAQVQSAKVGVEQARAESLQGDADNKALDFVERDTGSRQAHELDKQAMINQGNNERELIKQQGAMEQQNQQHDLNLLGQLANQQMAYDQAANIPSAIPNPSPATSSPQAPQQGLTL
ncbi:portal protein [Moraxella marmotae]|uniref:portal protein n=1 Tax=Moraxella marmotae TaxID=3344520 RepID=UPI0035F33D7F